MSAPHPRSAQSSLTSAQRLQFDVYGFVLLEDVLNGDEVQRMKQALYRLRAEPDLDAHRVYINRRDDFHFHVGHLIEYDPALLEYATHPKLLPLVREIVGGPVRLEESEALINSRDPGTDAWDPTKSEVEPIHFHTGARHGWATYSQHHHFRCLFVKTLTYLSDVGPGDGGTAVIPGSHRLAWPEEDIIAAALSDKRLIHQVEAKAGSVLLFPESLVHSTTLVQTANERVVLISGYTPPFIRPWPGNEPDEEFVASLPTEVEPLISGGDGRIWKLPAD
jgi:hypothetical protein